MKKYFALFIIVFGLTGLAGEKKYQYYQVDRVETLKGIVEKISEEKCFQKKLFSVIYIREEKSKKTVRVEVAPAWFFELDLMKGSRIEVSGSLNRGEKIDTMMLKSLTHRGKLYRFRDRMGFPLWRGGKQRRQRGSGQGRYRRSRGRT